LQTFSTDLLSVFKPV